MAKGKFLNCKNIKAIIKRLIEYLTLDKIMLDNSHNLAIYI